MKTNLKLSLLLILSFLQLFITLVHIKTSEQVSIDSDGNTKLLNFNEVSEETLVNSEFVVGKNYIVRYPRGTMEISGKLEKFLNKSIEFLKKNNQLCILFSIHSCNSRKYQDIIDGQEKFANDITKYLNDNGIPNSQIIATWRGSVMAVTSNDTPEGRRMNNRIEFTFEKMNK